VAVVLRVQAAVDGPAVVTFWHTAFIAKTLEMRVQVRRVGVGGGWGQGGARGGCVWGGGARVERERGCRSGTGPPNLTPNHDPTSNPTPNHP
jgi:hypothetical protein